ncbi:gfo/Idh/MocA family oxidoreductase, partial [Pseudomonas aeruginosa]|nr:gfo/Idh/MocA family oxidoreductase [Pseudomonas aeruginosa]
DVYKRQARQGWHDPLAASVEAVAAGDPLQRQLEHFVRVARGEEAPLMDATDAARTLALVEAVREAARSGRACAPASF